MKIYQQSLVETAAKNPPRSAAELEKYWATCISLQHVDALGPISLSRLLAAAGSIDALLGGRVDPATVVGIRAKACRQLNRLLRDPQSVPQWPAAERTVQWLLQTGSQLISFDDALFPPLLKQLSDCPPLLYAHGQVESLSQDAIAIVGARKPTVDGVYFTERLAADLAAAGMLVVSGMAMGTDTAAHQGALNVAGKTAAVWATGLDQVYPLCNRALADQISENGCVITEMPLGTGSAAGHFPRRNRLVSGISLGVVVVQAQLASGSMITASYAIEQNREVFAVPGLVHNPLSSGCHQLIKDGATLIESADDVLAALASMRLAQGLISPPIIKPGRVRSDELFQRAMENLPADLCRVLEVIGYDPVPFELIESRLDSSVDNLPAALVDLELQGLLSVTGGLYSRQYR